MFPLQTEVRAQTPLLRLLLSLRWAVEQQRQEHTV